MQRFATQGLAPAWQRTMEAFFDTDAGRGLVAFLRDRIQSGVDVLPPDPYHALRLTEPSAVKVVIFGQDPYPTPGHAIGLAFGTAPDVKPLPRSLNNIYKELKAEFGFAPETGDLTAWARQGVLLLNAVLTVEPGSAGAHAKKGWEALTDQLVRCVAAQPGPRVYLLWGAWAQKKEATIREAARGDVLILKANHPSPLSASRPPVPFFGCRHFALANAWLAERGVAPVEWVAQAQPAAQGSLF